MSIRRGRDVDDERAYMDVRVREREHDRDPLARYFQDDRRGETGALVLRQREVETVERPRRRARSPSQVRYREVVRERSPSPLPMREREQIDRIEVRDRIYDRDPERHYRREPSRGPQERIIARTVGRERERSPTPSPEREHERIRIIERSRTRVPSVSPSPSPPPVEEREHVRGPILEREVITHYTDVDHGVIYAPRAPQPQPEPRRERERERERDTEVDIYSSRHQTRVDIQESQQRPRAHSSLRAPARVSDREVTVRSDRNLLEVDVETNRQRRSRSAQPPARDRRARALSDEAQYIESRIDERGRIGEAYNGVTNDWTIVDVPPGTEHVRMDGVGGASADITWQRYNGVRRTRFIPEREGDAVAAPRRKAKEAPRERVRNNSRGEHISVQIIEDNRGHSRTRDRAMDVEADRTALVYPPAPQEVMPVPRNDMWTEITKDLVSREAMEYLHYKYEETEYFYYILQYLRYEEVQELVQLSDRIRRQRRRESRQLRENIDIDIGVRQGRHRSHSHHPPRRQNERTSMHEVLVDRSRPTYYR
ncbi:hypothetical protein SEPCBS119000_004409 [Sporothrix epigloea]|uniref:DUF8035 domain-containing protein n=1 Tax=Sporothrix epigloea TaxID=1892477 RepID=A0ABP0DT55_9PEZI